MDRKQFEEWFKTTLSYAIFEDSNVWKVDLYAFNEPTNSYLHSGVQAAFESYQHQQAKVEELQKQLSEYIFVAETIDEMYVKEVQKSDELQKRVDAVKGLAQTLWEKSNEKHTQGKVWESKALGECADEILDVIEQALKGEEQ
ncbi:hypothetical protein NRA61_13535 [Acinetobacter baumannii]|uniref:hypothetical protein n=1 Tax=Acinetobacter baumannii TaxID=470 RepID=UPI00233F6944|nr:hypothetical protein [Acinetobacter baumannii]